MSALPTVRIEHPDGFCIINESDFDPETQALFEEKPAPKKAAPKKAKPAPKTA